MKDVMRVPAAVSLVAAGVLWACSASQTPVPMSGSAADLSHLAGEWMGEYSSKETGRSCSIVVHMIA